MLGWSRQKECLAGNFALAGGGGRRKEKGRKKATAQNLIRIPFKTSAVFLPPPPSFMLFLFALSRIFLFFCLFVLFVRLWIHPVEMEGTLFFLIRMRMPLFCLLLEKSPFFTINVCLFSFPPNNPFLFFFRPFLPSSLFLAWNPFGTVELQYAGVKFVIISS